jgi:hypothetical protein
MADDCPSLIHLCRVRVTRLNADGTPTPGPNNVYISAKPIQLVVTPVYSAGKDLELDGGCDCLIASYRGDDKLKRFDFELDLGQIEWDMVEMLTGSTIVTSAGANVGVMFPVNQFQCTTPAQPLVGFEGWQHNWIQDHLDPVYPYTQWVFPGSKWAIQAMTLGNDFTQPKLTGFSRGNPNWGTGIYHDLPQAAGALGGGFMTATAPPADLCGYQTHAIT